MLARFLLDGRYRILIRASKEHSLNARIVLVALSLACYGLFGTLVNEWARPVAVQEETYGTSMETPASLPRSIVALPAVTPPDVALPTVTPPEEPAVPRAGYAAASLPSLEPLRAVTSLPTVTPKLETKGPDRTGCDPAYPEERTCIPAGPPFDQGCAVTSERLFKVLPPDPQRLDHDHDGIGCEPIRAST
jgi:hypothetical protein